MDIVLDPFPYTGTTTTCESLWMGVPVVTLCRPDRTCSRVGASILTNLDLPDLVAGTSQEYVQKAVALARDPDEILFLRETLRERMSRSPLMDAAGFTKALEALYRQMWWKWCLSKTTPPRTDDADDTGTIVSLSDE